MNQQTLDRLTKLSSPNQPRIVIKNCTALTFTGDSGYLENADIVIEDGKIVELGVGAAGAANEQNSVIIDGTDLIVSPGFVDTHRHSWSGFFRQYGTVDHYASYSNTMHQGFATQYTPQDMYAGGMLSSLSALDSGVTSLVDWSHNSRTPAHSDAAIQALMDTGIRGIYVFAAPRFNALKHKHPSDIQRLLDTWFPNKDQLVTMMFGTFRRASTNEIAWRPEGVAEPRPDLGAHLDLARSYGLRITVEGCSSPPSSQDLIELHAQGKLADDTTYVHVRDLNEAAWNAIKESGGHVSIAPNIGHGARQAFPSTQHALDHGIIPSVSLDIEFNEAGDFIGVLRNLSIAQRAYAEMLEVDGHPNPPKHVNPRQVLEFGTIAGARANGMEDITGSISVGKKADLLLIDTNNIRTFPVNNPFSAVLFHTSSQDIKGVLVEGRPVKWDGKLVGVDVDQARRIAETARDGLVERTVLRLSQKMPKTRVRKEENSLMKNTEQLEGYRLMVTSRYIDDASAAVLATGQDVPNYHGARGQEAMYAGAVMPLRQDDYLLYNYRAFATLLGKGVSLKELVHDLMLTAQGTTRGHGGIMHVTKPEVGIPGRNGVFGSKFGIALGLAQAAVLKGQQATVLCMFGEAEGNRGALYESLNIAVLRKLPIVYLAENNGFAVASRTETLYSGGNMSNLFRGFDLPVKSIDGNDFETVSTTIAEAVELARQGGGPSYVECLTYRLDPHHGHDDDTLYRDQKEVEQRQEQSDPIVTLRNTLLTNGVGSSELEEIERVAEQHVQEAFAEALAAAAPDISGLLNQVYFKAGAHQ